MRNFLLLIVLYPFGLLAQVADSSFFPNVKTINPGISHLRENGFVSINKGISKVEKHHDVGVSFIQGGIDTALELDKLTLYRAGKGGGMTLEFLYDQEEADKVEKIKSSSRGDREVNTEAKANYIGGIIDFGFIGVLVGSSDYAYDYRFRVGSAPNISAKDLYWNRDYKVVKVGSAFKVAGISLGAFAFKQQSQGDLDIVYYDPANGEKGSTENYEFESDLTGLGLGVGYKTKALRFEVSYESAQKETLDKDANFPVSFDPGKEASRIGLVGEVKFKYFALGAMFRRIEGNFTDLEDIISANLLYSEMGSSDTRTEKAFNFSFGDDEGFTLSGYYSVSEADTEEESDIFDNGETYPATTETTSYGVSVSYVY